MNVDASGTYTVVMSRPGWLDSDAVTWSADFYVQDLSVTPPSGYIGVPNTPVSAGSAYWYYRPLDHLLHAGRHGAHDQLDAVYARRFPSAPTPRSSGWRREAGIIRSFRPTCIISRQQRPFHRWRQNYYNAQDFTLTPYLAGSAVYYSTNSSDWHQYTGPFTVDGSTLIQYYANNAGRLSPTGSLQASFVVSPLAITPGGGDIDSPITLTASTPTLGAQITYGLGDEDGNPPGGGGILYTNPVDGRLRPKLDLLVWGHQTGLSRGRRLRHVPGEAPAARLRPGHEHRPFGPHAGHLEFDAGLHLAGKSNRQPLLQLQHERDRHF